MLEKHLRDNSRGWNTSSGDQFMTLEDIFRIVRRRKKGIILSIVLSFSGALTYHYLRVPEYRAVSILMINEKQDQNDLFSKVVGAGPGVPENQSVKKDAELIKSMPISEKAITELNKSGISGPLEIFGARPYQSPLAILIGPVLPLFAAQNRDHNLSSDEMLRRKAIELNQRIKVEPVRETNVLKVSVASPFADEAAILTNTICRVYREADITRNSEKYAQANRFIAEMLDEQQRKVAETDSALSRYMSSHEIFEVTGNTQQLLEKLIEADARYNDLMAEYNIARNNLNFLDTKLSEADKSLSTRIAKSVTDQLGSMMDEMRTCENDYVQIVKEKGVDASESRAKRQQLDVVKARYEQLSRSKIAGQIGYAGRAQKYSFDMVSEKLQIERKLNELNFSAREFSRRKEYYEHQLGALPKKEQEYVKLQRDREAVSKTYVYLKEKLDESRILLGSEIGSVSVVGSAFQPVKPESPDMKKTLLLGLMFGGFIAVVYTYGAESRDDTVKDVSFFRENRLGRVFRIPFVTHHAGSSGSSSSDNDGSVLGIRTDVPMISDQLSTSFAESFRTLRTHLDYLSHDQPSQSILVSGSMAKEGKTSVCANLGLAFALAGRKTLIVDCDLQHASQHEVFNCAREEGVTDYLLSSEKFLESRYIQQTPHDNLYVLSAGSEVSNPGELLGSVKMEALLKSLSGQFDRVLLDAPSLFLSDSVRLAQLVDTILLVSRLGHTCRKPVIELAMDEFLGPKVFGVAVIDPSGSNRKGHNRYLRAS
jgi:capsular exopolysaccharide synthesis family protein